MKKAWFLDGLVVLFLAGCGSAVPTPADPGGATPTRVSITTAETVLKRAAESICPPPKDPAERDPYPREYESSRTKFTFFCSPAAGHGTSAILLRFESTAGAQAGFEAKRKQTEVEDFHGSPLAVMEEDYPGFPGDRKEYRIWLWQAGQWVTEVRAFDDTPYLSAPAPAKVSEEIYKAGMEMGLFPS